MNHEPARSRWAAPVTLLLAGIAVSVVLSLILRAFVPVFILFLPLFWTGRRR